MKKKIIYRAFRKSQALLLSAVVFLSALSGVTLAKYAGSFTTNGFSIAIKATSGSGTDSGYAGEEETPDNNESGFAGGVTGSYETFTAEASGYYKLEVWGAQGGNCTTTVAPTNEHGTYGAMTRYGGRGGYAAGYVKLNKGDTLYITVGGQGQGSTAEDIQALGGYNGGGAGNISSSDVNHVYGGGGGATHIARSLQGDEKQGYGLLKSYVNNKDDVLIVAGGGGGARLQANASYDDRARWGNGGDGSGANGGVGLYKDGASLEYREGNDPDNEVEKYTSHTVFNELAATDTHGFAFGLGESENGQGGGGGGWYGGHGGMPNEHYDQTANPTHTDRYTGFGLGGSGHLRSDLIGKVTGTGIKAGNGKAKITYMGKDESALPTIAVPEAETYDNSGFVCALSGEETRVATTPTTPATASISLFGENGAIDGATK